MHAPDDTARILEISAWGSRPGGEGLLSCAQLLVSRVSARPAQPKLLAHKEDRAQGPGHGEYSLQCCGKLAEPKQPRKTTTRGSHVGPPIPDSTA